VRAVDRLDSERHDVAVGAEHAVARSDAGDAAALHVDAFGRGLEAEAHAAPAGVLGQRLREEIAVAGLVGRKMESARKRHLRVRERRSAPQPSARAPRGMPLRSRMRVWPATACSSTPVRRSCRMPRVVASYSMPVALRSSRRHSRL
jgi:hypothetical protein